MLRQDNMCRTIPQRTGPDESRRRISPTPGSMGAPRACGSGSALDLRDGLRRGATRCRSSGLLGLTHPARLARGMLLKLSETESSGRIFRGDSVGTLKTAAFALRAGLVGAVRHADVHLPVAAVLRRAPGRSEHDLVLESPVCVETEHDDTLMGQGDLERSACGTLGLDDQLSRRLSGMLVAGEDGSRSSPWGSTGVR